MKVCGGLRARGCLEGRREALTSSTCVFFFKWSVHPNIKNKHVPTPRFSFIEFDQFEALIVGD